MAKPASGEVEGGALSSREEAGETGGAGPGMEQNRGSHRGCGGGSKRWTGSGRLEVELGRTLGQFCRLSQGLWLSCQLYGGPGGWGLRSVSSGSFQKGQESSRETRQEAITLLPGSKEDRLS